MTDHEPVDRPQRRWIWATALGALVVAIVATGAYAIGRNHHNNSSDTMATRAQNVMPFDLTATTHIFTKTADGGVQKVVVKTASDTTNQALIRAHLQAEADAFRHGNYNDPAKIHGMDMPGMTELEHGATRIKVTYTQIPGGATITYRSTEPALVAALHSWFDRQASDHAMPGMGG